ncbi:MAG: tetratricopeptide repeat protein [Planctomycetaceae bacterium]
MLKPRIFVSAVTRELSSARQLVVNTLIALGYEPDWQDIFETSSDDIRPMLREKIDGCAAVLQIVGDAYGAEAPVPDETFGRVSYTQYEALYAKSKGKKVYYLIALSDLPRDAAADTLDQPRDNSPEQIADAAARRQLQADYRAQRLGAEQIYYPVSSHPETELSVRRLRDDLAQFRRGYRLWMVGITAALVLIVGGIVWLNRGQQHQGQQLHETQGAVKQAAATVEENNAKLQQLAEQLDNPDDLRAAFTRTITRVYDEAIAAADLLPGWREREQAKEQATTQRDQHLARVDEWINSILVEIRSGKASPEYLEMLRIFNSEGTEEAIAYILSRKQSLLERFDRDQQASRERNLLPLLEAVRKQVLVADYAAAHDLCEELLERDPAWAHALHEQFWIITELGDRALKYETVSVAEQKLQQAERLALRLVNLPTVHPQAQRDLSVSHNKLGDVLRQMGQPQAALEHYEAGLKIREQLAAADERDAQAQRDLSISHNKLGNVLLQMGQPQAAFEHYEADLKISQQLAAADERDAQAQRDLSVSHNKLGDVLLQVGQPQAALQHYEECHEVLTKLAAADERDAQAQRDLSVSHDRLGDALRQMGQPQAALEHYEEGLKIREQLAAADERDAQAQRDLSISHNKLGDVLLQMGQPQAALEHYVECHEVLTKLAAADERDAQAQRSVGLTRQARGCAAANGTAAGGAPTLRGMSRSPDEAGGGG